MKKRILSILLCLCMVMALLPTTALATEGHTHCICGASHTSVGDHTVVNSQTFTEWTSTTALPNAEGYYYLTKDVTLSATWTVPTGTTVLCLNGKTITANGDFDCIKVTSKSYTLTLCDCKPDEVEGSITHSSGTGRGVNTTGTFNMYGGTISGNTAGANVSGGGGVYVGGTFNMYGGTISGNTTVSGRNGGGVYVNGSSAAFNMSGSASITNNAAFYGGGVYVEQNGTFNMAGGSITNNVTSESYGVNGPYPSGGGVHVENGTFKMSAGTITNNTSAKNGGGVYVGSHGEFTMSNSASITGNTASGYGDGGGVFVNEGGTFQMSGNSRITSNTGYRGGGVSVDRSLGTTYNPGAFTMSSGNITNNKATFGGGVYISGNFTMSGGKISSNRATGDSGGVHMNTDSTFTVSGAPKITDNTLKSGTTNNVCLSEGTSLKPDATITIGAAHLSTGASIGVTTEKTLTTGSSVTIATGAKSGDEKYFTSDADRDYHFVLDGNEVKLGQHEHNWQYTLSEDKTTITATCNATGCTSTPYSETLTISAPEPAVLTYDGNVKAATLGAQSELKSGLKDAAITYAKTDDDTFSGTPTDAGTYTASITVGDQTASVEYTITRKSVTNPTIEVASGSTYDGTAKRPPVTVKDGGTTIDSNEYTVVYSNNIKAGTDTATVTVTDNAGGNYILSEKQQTFTIAQKDLANDDVTVAAIPDQTYTGSAIQPEPAVTYNNMTLVKGTDYTLSYGDNTNVGDNSGSVTITAKDGGNYTGTKTVNFNIVAKPGQVTISGDLNVTYGTEVPDVTINRYGSAGTTTVYYYTASDCSAGETTTKPTTAGDYWAKVKMDAEGNYGAAESNVIGFTISRADIIPAVSITDWTYKGSANAPSVTGNTGNGTVTYAYKVRNANDNTYSSAVPTQAGDYTVKATVAQTTNYNGGFATKDFTISPKTISGATIVDVANQPYNNGTAITPTPAVSDGGTPLTVGTDFTYSYENNINAGTATVKITGKGNYTGTASKTFQIIRADLAITVSITGWVVGGTPNAPSVSGNLGNGAVTYQYKVKDAGDNTYSSTVPTAEGNYTVKATVAQTANYNAASATADFAISTKAPQTVTAGNLTVKYGDTDKAVSASTNGDGTISYSVKSGSEYVEVNSSTGALTIKKVGTATITVTASETDSYAAASKDITVTVAPLAVTAPTADTTVFTYNGQNQAYGVTETANYTVSNGLQKNAGNYTVTVALKDKDNTVWVDSSDTADKTFGFEIKKATITITAKDKSAYVNDTAPTLGEGDYTVSGLATGESLKTLPTIAYASTPDMTKAGTVSITVSGAEAPDGGNYNDIIYNNGTFTISTRPSSGGGGYTPPTYKVESEVAETADGSVSFSKNSAKKGDTVTITVTPDRYYKVDGVTVKDSSGKEIAVTDNGDGTFTFKMPGSKVTVEPVFSWDNPFADVAENAYYAPAVEWALKNDITDGVDAAHFAPNASCTRAQIVTFLWRAAGCPAPKSSTMPFTDVKAGSYYETAVLWAVENGITKGTGDTTFSPNATCSRAQIVSFLYRAASSPAVSGSAVFTDVSAGSYYANAVAWAVENGITGGTGNNAFSPNADCTRAQIVSFLYRWMVK